MLGGPALAETTTTPQGATKAGEVETSLVGDRLPVGFWSGQWNTEHGALELYRMWRQRLPEGETARTVDGLIEQQHQQIRLFRKLYTAVMQPGSTELTTPRITPEIPPSKAPWQAHRPPTNNEIAWTALDYERRALLGYESIASTLRAEPLRGQAETLLSIQKRQIDTLLRLAGEPPR
jgi:rubrerythrin